MACGCPCSALRHQANTRDLLLSAFPIMLGNQFHGFVFRNTVSNARVQHGLGEFQTGIAGQRGGIEKAGIRPARIWATDNHAQYCAVNRRSRTGRHWITTMVSPPRYSPAASAHASPSRQTCTSSTGVAEGFIPLTERGVGNPHHMCNAQLRQRGNKFFRREHVMDSSSHRNEPHPARALPVGC